MPAAAPIRSPRWSTSCKRWCAPRARNRAALLLRLLTSNPCAAAKGGRSGPKGTRDGSRVFCCGPWMARQQNPAARSEPADRRARHPGALSLGYFSLGKQREVTGAQGCATKAQGCESVLATEPQERKNKELGPRLRGDDEGDPRRRSKWIPASAGTTAPRERCAQRTKTNHPPPPVCFTPAGPTPSARPA
jgi:hypothetical protein